ncbi:alanyl (membrane) aminopeptidase-like b [Ictalurus punctatus]|uniref:Aminopeptidase n=1 Tax=Ictalurus punctatus TaxID=7998 RepID=W5UIW4_ICTPU|nr:alanyl (membrane) aminopeptidase-like b [Ictalurus punctatus]XP_017321403.1 alanyl (membrane) aminopeptidase-like b [Ictalurus punctatus]XP_017321404.1 alanyl (membrane) aminopeptidase-like b [Ictalurus punctatus]
MAKGVYISKSLAIATGVLTLSALGGIIVMITLYQMQIEKNPPVRPPRPVPTTPIPTGLPPTLRLPDNLIPESYEVNLQPYLYVELPNATEQVYIFEGNSTVRFKCVKDTWTIFLHALDLSIDKVIVTHSNTKEIIGVERYTLHNDSHFFEILLKKRLVGNGDYYDLFTKFKGELLDDLTGLYTSQYTEISDGEEEKRFLVASQMQATEARKVFPCFDEPAMKAVFNITIIHRAKTKALSNARSDNERYVDGDKWVATTFAPTPIMSTYLLAFTVNTFLSESDKHDDKEISIWARPEAVAAGHATYAMNITGKILSFYEKKFNLKYPLKKLDQMALPDFSAGAMENWGLTMYRESALLYKEGVSSSSDKEWVAIVIAHELAHQWFGNLVTMNWWNNLWLSEGFATYLSYLGVNDIEPTWNIRDMFVLKEIQPVMELDSLNASHPLSLKESEVETTSDILGLFDSITYNKGAAVLRMLSTYMGEEKFFEGLRNYLEKYKYKTADTADLWKCMDEATHEDIESMMTTWTEQVGYPVIHINTTTGEIAQEHFLLKRAEDTGLEWQVPIIYMKSDFTQQKASLKEKGPVRKPIFEVTDDGWLLVNINSSGYYRVNYDDQNWNRLIDQLESDHQGIPLINRGQLIDDAFNLARAKYINVSLALSTTKYLINETEYIPWESALNNLGYFILMFDRSEVYGPMQKYLRKQVGPLYKYFQEYTDNATVPDILSDQYNQINAISVACSNGLTECTDMATKLFNEWKNGENGTNRIPPNLKSTIYCNAIAVGNEDDWDFAWKQYKEATIATEQDVLRYALSCTKIIWLLNRYLEYTLDPNKIRKMDVVSTINYIAKNVAGQALAWDFIRAQWTYISQLYGGGIISVGSLIDDVTERFSTDFELQQLKQFRSEFDEDGLGPTTRALDQAIERTEANIKWVKENKQTVLNWFIEQAQVY